MKTVGSFSRWYVVLVASVLAVFGYLYYMVSTVDEKLGRSVETILMNKAQYFADNIVTELKNRIPGDLYETLKNDPKLRAELEHMFSVVITPSFKYIFILYRDAKGRYRYLLDGSKEDKGEFGQRLNVETEKWDKVYETGKPVTVLQNDIDGLWITYLTPIVYDGEVKAVLAIDFSTKLLQFVETIMGPIHHLFIYLLAAGIAILAVISYQVFISAKERKKSITDALTGVYNRNFLRDFLKKSNPSEYQIAMLDIDHFKKINDNYGHKAGDYVLTETAKLIRDTIREKDMVVRFGGEEFLIFFNRRKEEHINAYEIADRLRRRIESHRFVFEGYTIKVTVSIGVVLYPERFKSLLDAIKRADQKLYVAKRQGRNQVIHEEGEGQRDGERRVLSIQEVKEALDDGRIFCEYQPIYNLRTNEVQKYEALVRLRDASGQTVYPSAFLEHIAGTNVYNDLTKEVLEIVLGAIKEYQVPISVNLNISDILDNVVYKTIISEIRTHAALVRFLTVELLEYEKAETELLKKRLAEIRSYGVQIALDDFGSGYSNFAILKECTVDIVKIDGSLVKGIVENSTSYHVTESIAGLCMKMGIRVVAEFIHNEAVLDAVKKMGIDCGQGFYLGKPGDLSERAA